MLSIFLKLINQTNKNKITFITSCCFYQKMYSLGKLTLYCLEELDYNSLSVFNNILQSTDYSKCKKNVTYLFDWLYIEFHVCLYVYTVYIEEHV